MPGLCRWAALLLCVVSPVGAQNPAVIPVPRSDAWWVSRHEETLKRVKSHPDADLVFVGDSITQNYEKTGPAPNEVFAPLWQEFFAPHHALNLGYSGDETQHVLWRLAHGEVQGLSPSNVVLLIGTNNTASTTEPQSGEQVAAGVQAVVAALHILLPKARLLLTEILPSEVSVEKSAKDTAVNAAVRVAYRNSDFVQVLDLAPLYVKEGQLQTALFYDPQLVPPRPALHPNTKGQRLMAAAIAKTLYGPTASR